MPSTFEPPLQFPGTPVIFIRSFDEAAHFLRGYGGRWPATQDRRLATATTEEQIARMAHDDAAIRRYLVEHEILTVPPDLPHWTLRAMPEYVAAFDGFVAKYMGDGVLAYFGYPQAHEDDAERAVRSALTLITVVAQATSPTPLRVRIGIAGAAQHK